LIKFGPQKSVNFTGAVAENVDAVKKSLDDVVANLTIPDYSAAYSVFSDFVIANNINCSSPPSDTLILLNTTSASATWANIKHLFIFNNWEPTGLNLSACVNLISLGFINGPGLTADQRTQISTLAKTYKKLQTLVVTDWGDSTIAAEAFSGTGEGADSGSLVRVIIHKATIIQRNAFRFCCNLTTVFFPDVFRIQGEGAANGAFSYCTSLTKVSFPSAEILEIDPFSHCPSLVTASFPIAKSIGKWAFCDGTSLKVVIYPATANVDSSAFDRCLSTLQILNP
ncbi:MAG: leucine-rich repeat domain-containing protein, partial [Holosporales bacterium]|nr:leucine-rich repeat domain-containing protein [Holosporales bacterium]